MAEDFWFVGTLRLGNKQEIGKQQSVCRKIGKEHPLEDAISSPVSASSLPCANIVSRY